MKKLTLAYVYPIFLRINVLKIKVLCNLWLQSAQRLHFTTVSQGEILKKMGQRLLCDEGDQLLVKNMSPILICLLIIFLHLKILYALVQRKFLFLDFSYKIKMVIFTTNRI